MIRRVSSELKSILVVLLSSFLFACGGDGGGSGDNGQQQPLPPTLYNVTFYDGGNIMSELSLTVESGTTVTLPTITKDGYNFDGWLFGGTDTMLTGSYQVTGNTVFHAKFTPLYVSYTVSFYEDGNFLPGLGSRVNSGDTVTLPSRSKDGHLFEGWLLNNTGSPVTGEYTVTGNAAFYAKYTVIEYTVSFYDENGDLIAGLGGQINAGSGITLPNRTKPYHTFNGWLVNNTGSPVNGSWTVTGDVNLYAQFTAIQYSVNYYDEGGILISELSGPVNAGTEITLPNRTKPYHTFNGWLINNTGSPVTGNRTVTGDLNFYANFTAIQYTVNYYDENAVLIPGISGPVNAGTDITLPGRTKPNHTFNGWRVNNAGIPITGSYAVTGSVNFYANFTAVQYTVNYYDEESNLITELSGPVNAGQITLPDRTKPYNTFNGWLINNIGSPLTGNYTVNGNLNFYAKFTAVQYTVNYYDEGGTLITGLSGLINAGTEITLPDRTKPYNTFNGWLVNNTGNPITGNYTVTGNLNFYAQFTAIQYTVSYYDEASNLITELSGLVNGGTITLPNRTKPYYTFNGWLIDNTGTPITGSYTVEGDLNFYAQFAAIQYTVNYYDEDGIITELSGPFNAGPITLPTRSKPDHTFEGWLIDNAGNPHTATYTLISNVDFYAKFTITQYNVNYYDEDGLISELSGLVNVGTSITLPDRTKPYHTFDGWLVNNTGTPVTGSYMVAGNLDFYAQFTVIQYTVNYYDEAGILISALSGYKNAGTDIILPTRSKLGYTFDGWLINRAGVPLTGSYTVTENVKFYAFFYIPIYDDIDLDNIRNNLSADYRLMNDISLSDYNADPGWIPIGTENAPFTGSLDGGGYKVTELYINGSAEFAGLFGKIKNGSVSNLGVETTTTGIINSAGLFYIGGIAGHIETSSINNCYSIGDITAAASVGSSYTYVGGIVGSADESSVTGSYSTGNISIILPSSADPSYAGGIAGSIYKSSVAGSYSTGDITSSTHNDSHAGGIVGRVYIGTVTDCYSTGDITSNAYEYFSYAGGIVGYGDVSGENDINSIVGCYSTGDITSSSESFYSYAGGIVGRNIGSVTDSYSTGNVTSSTSSMTKDTVSSAGGIAGSNTGSITGSYSTGDIASTSQRSSAGGIAGSNIGSVTESYSTGNVTSSSLIPSSYFTSSSYAGGIVGGITGTVTNSYSTGSIESYSHEYPSYNLYTSYAGGIAGYVSNNGGITGCVAANQRILGMGSRIVGYIDGSPAVSNNFARSDMRIPAVNFNSANYGISKTESELKHLNTFTGLGWDFAMIWKMDNGYGFPVFQGQEPIVKIYVEGNITESPVINSTFTVPANLSDPDFLGWNSSLDGQGTVLSPNSTVNVSAGFTVYALLKGRHPNYPIDVSNEAALYAMRNKPSLHYKLTTDIPLNSYRTGAGWEPIGTEAEPFSGSLNGNGYRVRYLYIDRNSQYMGLFGYLTGSVSNLGVAIERFNVGFSYPNDSYYGGSIAGRVDYGTITNSYSSGSSVSGGSYVGGIAGYASYSTITKSYTTVMVYTDFPDVYVGGIAGYIAGSSIVDSYSTTSVSTTSGYAGGIAGQASYSTIIRCYSAGNISASYPPYSSDVSYAGGIVGRSGGGYISDCYSLGYISAYATIQAYAGGIAGYGRIIINSYATGGVLASSDTYAYAGGIAGYIYDTITGSVAASSNIKKEGSGTVYISRIVGYRESTINVSNNFANYAMTATGATFNTTPANYGVSKYLADLQTVTPYIGVVNGDGLGGLGWQFGNDTEHPWKMPASGTGYPILYWQE